LGRIGGTKPGLRWNSPSLNGVIAGRGVGRPYARDLLPPVVTDGQIEYVGDRTHIYAW
jgi:hypothetical protein